MNKMMTTEQHLMLESLTGKQYNRNGTIRKKQNRSHMETKRLGLDLYHWGRNRFQSLKADREKWSNIYSLSKDVESHT